MKILFVCLGNICRSPTAESIFQKKLMASFPSLTFDSAGTAAYHTGEPSDPRSIEHARSRGYEMTHLARQVSIKDFYEFDLIFAMDQANQRDLRQLCPEESLQKKIYLITDFAKKIKQKGVPDPYHGGADGFDFVIDLLEDCVSGVVEKLIKNSSSN